MKSRKYHYYILRRAPNMGDWYTSLDPHQFIYCNAPLLYRYSWASGQDYSLFNTIVNVDKQLNFVKRLKSRKCGSK